jgi:Chalcone isomerase-like
MRSSILTAVICLVLAFSIGAAVQEPKTGVSFEESVNQSGTDLVLAGVGVRTKMMVKVYAEALYLDPSVKTDLAQFKSEAAKPSENLYNAMIQGDFAKLFVLHFVRDVSGEQVSDAMKKALAKHPNMSAPDIQKDMQTFLTACTTDMKDGQILKILVKGDEVTVIPSTGDPTVIKNGKLADAVPAIWLGKDPISDDLKKGLVSRLSQIL